MRQFESLMDRYYRDDPLERARSALNASIQEHNRWVESARAEFTKTIAKLNRQVEEIKRLDKLTDEMDEQLAEKPDVEDRAAVEAYNALADERNARVKEYNKLLASHKRREEAYRESREQHQREADARRVEVETQQAEFEQRVEEHKRWFKTAKDLALFKTMNRFYARLREDNEGDGSPEVVTMRERVRAIRRELFEFTVASHRRVESGAVIVEATVCGEEPCFLLVDTGAMQVTLPLSLVQVLGLSDRLGDEVTVKVAGGGHIRGRELVIPRLAVLGTQADDVQAIVLDEFDAGVDGLLGLSYLKQFAFRVDHSQKDKFVISPKSGGSE